MAVPVQEKLDKWLSRLSGIYSFWPLVPGGLISAAVGYTSQASATIRGLGIFGSLAAGLLSFTAISVSLYLLALWRERWIFATYVRDRSKKPDFVNFIDSEFTRKRLSFADLVRPSTNYIEGKTFTDCELLGPALIAAERGSMTGVGFVNCNWIVIRSNQQVSGVTVLKDVTVRGGSIHDVTVLVAEEHLGLIRGIGVKPLNRTGDPEIDARVDQPGRAYFN